MKHTKIMITAVAVLFAIMPVTVEARYTEDTFYMQYPEGHTRLCMAFRNQLLTLET